MDKCRKKASASLQTLIHETVRCPRRFTHHTQLRQSPQKTLKVSSEQTAILRGRQATRPSGERTPNDQRVNNCRRERNNIRTTSLKKALNRLLLAKRAATIKSTKTQLFKSPLRLPVSNRNILHKGHARRQVRWSTPKIHHAPN